MLSSLGLQPVSPRELALTLRGTQLGADKGWGGLTLS